MAKEEPGKKPVLKKHSPGHKGERVIMFNPPQQLTKPQILSFYSNRKVSRILAAMEMNHLRWIHSKTDEEMLKAGGKYAATLKLLGDEAPQRSREGKCLMPDRSEGQGLFPQRLTLNLNALNWSIKYKRFQMELIFSVYPPNSVLWLR